jgi:organic hydroperoxide reductase OsmC/OhrA
MSEHSATISWRRGADPFVGQRYSRGHEWRFDGGIRVAASASPAVVSAPWSVPAAVDPEEAFVAAIASCHMLWFLSLAADRGWLVDSYDDEAVGLMGRNAERRLAVIRVTLRPLVVCGGQRQPTPDEVNDLHHAAHEACFIANSVRTEILCEPR